MTTKTTKYLSMLAVLAVAFGGIIYTTNFDNVDADSINKGIGTTDVWEPGPTDGFTPTDAPQRTNDARLSNEYDRNNPVLTKNTVTDAELKEKFLALRQAKIGITSMSIDYDIGQLVLYSSDLTIEKNIKAIIGDFPFVLIYEEEHPLRNSNRDGPPPSIDTQSVEDPLLNILSSAGIINYAYAVSDSAHGTKINSDSGSTYTGAYAKLEIHDSGVTIPSGDTVFGGNIMPNSKSSLEWAIEYKPSTTKVRIYDHYAGVFSWSADVDSTFMSTYSTTISGSKYIYVKVEENSGTWMAYIYNFNTSQWEFKDSQALDGSRTDGWSVWEEYSLSGDCASATIPEITGTLVQVRSGSTWYFVTSTYGSQYNTANNIPCYSEYMDANYYNWRVS